MKKLIILTGIIFCFSIKFFAQVSPYEPEVLKAFADSLYQEGFLSQAEGEYKRYLFTDQTTTPAFQSSLLSLCNIYKTQKNKDGIMWLNDKFYDFAELNVKEKISLVRGSFVFKERKAHDFSLFTASISNDINSFSPDFSRLIQVSDCIVNNDVPSLKTIVPAFAEQSDTFEKLNELCGTYKTKSPGCALFLSFLFPGMGKWYTGSFSTFLATFLSIGSFAAGTVITGIQTEWKSWQPYVFGTCGLILYITELYGSYKSAQRYNDALFRALCEETERIYEISY